MRLLVIGSEGNIGRPLCAHLRAQGHDVTEADIRPGWRSNYITADICLPLDLEDAIAHADVALLLSAVVSRVVCEQAALLAYATNLQGAAGIARLCARHGTGGWCGQHPGRRA
jgi:dTDP-4-dehydrorhamnose reductase